MVEHVHMILEEGEWMEEASRRSSGSCSGLRFGSLRSRRSRAKLR